jgi:hypothetical protein
MPPSLTVRQITSVVSDGTGLTKEEIWLFGGVAAVAAVVSGVVHAVDALTRLRYDLGDL